MVLALAAVLGGLLSLAGEYLQRLYQLAQRQPYYELRELEPDSREEAPPADGDRA
jgi:hypothetical protein